MISTLVLVLLQGADAARDTVTLTLAASEHDRRFVLAEAEVRLAPPFKLREKDGAEVPCQGSGGKVRWLVAEIPAKQKKSYVLEKGEPARAHGLELKENAAGSLSIRLGDREVTRYYPVAGVANKKPCFYPLVAGGVNVLRGFPLEERAGDVKDHPHHTGIYNAFGDVNGKDYWSKTSHTFGEIERKEAGPVAAGLVAVNKWGDDLVERQEILVLNAGADAVMDWTVTLTAANGPVVLGRDTKMSKEGFFSVRVASGLSAKGDAPEMIRDSKGNKGEKAIRADTAPWVHYTGDVDGKRVGVSIMQHPGSFRYPSNWHVRAYGLFAANAFLVAGKHELGKGDSITLRYRVYAHGGDFDAGKVPAVYAGYADVRVAVE